MRLLSLFFFLILACRVSAQQELLLHSSPDLWHSNTTNPAIFPKDKRFAIGLPAYSIDATHSGELTYNDVFLKRNSTYFLDFGKAIDKLEDQNTLHFDQRIETVSVGYRLSSKWVLQAGHANRFTGEIAYPKALPSLLWNGNGAYIGQTLHIGPNVQLFNWNEWSAGLIRSFGRLNVGAKIKYLTGISALVSDKRHTEISVYTDPDIYQLTLNTDYAFNSSSIITAFDTSGLGFKAKLGSYQGKAFTANRGLAFDFGFSWQLTNRISVRASIIDWNGKINWTEKAGYYKSNGTYQYDGVTFPGTDILNGGDSLDFETKLDTLNDVFKFVKTAQDFTSTLPVRYYLGGNFAFNSRWSFGATYFIQKGVERHQAIGFSARWSVLKWLSLTGMYSINDKTAKNFGFQGIMKLGPVQMYLMSDNLVKVFSVKKTPAFNLRAGASLIF
ncbi:MAG: hypothetical protein KGS48_13380 [Bacteroidetes bacterium]|nr:hypothetical protein [Bacteroidota bacterium]